MPNKFITKITETEKDGDSNPRPADYMSVSLPLSCCVFYGNYEEDTQFEVHFCPILPSKFGHISLLHVFFGETSLALRSGHSGRTTLKEFLDRPRLLQAGLMHGFRQLCTGSVSPSPNGRADHLCVPTAQRTPTPAPLCLRDLPTGANPATLLAATCWPRHREMDGLGQG